MLRSLKVVHKLAAELAVCRRRAPPDPRPGPPVEVSGGHPPGLIQVSGSTAIWSRQRLPAKEAPPAFLEGEPPGCSGDEDQVDPRMLVQPGVNRWARVAGEMIGDQIPLPRRAVLVDRREQGQGADRGAGGGAHGQRVSIAHPQGPLEPDPVFSWAVLQRGLDAVPIGDQPGSGAARRGVTGPSSSGHRVVPGGSGSSETTAVRLGRRCARGCSPRSGSGARGPPGPAECGAPDCA